MVEVDSLGDDHETREREVKEPRAEEAAQECEGRQERKSVLESSSLRKRETVGLIERTCGSDASWHPRTACPGRPRSSPHPRRRRPASSEARGPAWRGPRRASG